ncbi:hypothetical protein AAMO2058_000702100 [Amorphochlora amoebiformis]
MGNNQVCTTEEEGLKRTDVNPLNQIWRVRHPESGQFLRCREIERIKRDSNDFDIYVQWQKYHWEEVPKSISHCTEPIDSKLAQRDVLPSNKYITFIQTVGLPGHSFEIDSQVEYQDESKQWRPAKIISREKYYYQVESKKDESTKADDEDDMEWVHVNSSRIRHLRPVDDDHHDDEEVEEKNFDDKRFLSFHLQGFVEAKYPGDNTFHKAKVVARSPLVEKKRYIVVQFLDETKLATQRTIFESEFDNPAGREVIRHLEEKIVRWKDTRIAIYKKALESIGYRIVTMKKDAGNSMYRSLSHQIYGTATNFKAIRIKCNKHLSKHKDYFQHFVDVDFEKYLAAKKKGAELDDFYCPGDHLDLQAIAEIYDCSITVYSRLSERPLDEIVFYGKSTSKFSRLPNIILSYTGNDEYDSVISDTHGVPLKVTTNVNTFKDLHLMENDNKEVILKARIQEFNRMKATYSNQLLKSSSVSNLNPLKAYIRTKHKAEVKTESFSWVEGICAADEESELTDDQLLRKGRLLHRTLTSMGIQAGNQPSSFGKSSLGLLSKPRKKKDQEKPAEDDWKDKKYHDPQKSIAQIEFKKAGPSHVYENKNARTVIVIKGRLSDVQELQAAMCKLLGNMVEFKQKSLVTLSKRGSPATGKKGKKSKDMDPLA